MMPDATKRLIASVDVLPLHFEDEGNFSLGDTAAAAYRNRCQDD